MYNLKVLITHLLDRSVGHGHRPPLPAPVGDRRRPLPSAWTCGNAASRGIFPMDENSQPNNGIIAHTDHRVPPKTQPIDRGMQSNATWDRLSHTPEASQNHKLGTKYMRKGNMHASGSCIHAQPSISSAAERHIFCAAAAGDNTLAASAAEETNLNSAKGGHSFSASAQASASAEEDIILTARAEGDVLFSASANKSNTTSADANTSRSDASIEQQLADKQQAQDMSAGMGFNHPDFIPAHRNEVIIAALRLKELQDTQQPADEHGTSMPQQHGTSMPQQHGTSMPQQHGTSMPQQHGTVPQQHGTMPQQHGTSMPQQHGTSMPQQHGTSIPQQHGTSMPQQHGASMPKLYAGTLSFKKGIQQHGASMPQQPGTMPQQHGTRPQQHGTSMPQQPGTTPQQQKSDWSSTNCSGMNNLQLKGSLIDCSATNPQSDRHNAPCTASESHGRRHASGDSPDDAQSCDPLHASPNRNPECALQPSSKHQPAGGHADLDTQPQQRQTGGRGSSNSSSAGDNAAGVSSTDLLNSTLLGHGAFGAPHCDAWQATASTPGLQLVNLTELPHDQHGSAEAMATAGMTAGDSKQHASIPLTTAPGGSSNNHSSIPLMAQGSSPAHPTAAAAMTKGNIAQQHKTAAANGRVGAPISDLSAIHNNNAGRLTQYDKNVAAPLRHHLFETQQRPTPLQKENDVTLAEMCDTHRAHIDSHTGAQKLPTTPDDPPASSADNIFDAESNYSTAMVAELMLLLALQSAAAAPEPSWLHTDWLGAAGDRKHNVDAPAEPEAAGHRADESWEDHEGRPLRTVPVLKRMQEEASMRQHVGGAGMQLFETAVAASQDWLQPAAGKIGSMRSRAEHATQMNSHSSALSTDQSATETLLGELALIHARYEQVDGRLDAIERQIVDLTKALRAVETGAGGATEVVHGAAAAVTSASKGIVSEVQIVKERQQVGLFDINKLQSRLTEVMNSGYFESVKQLRETLMVQEWELSLKHQAKLRGVADFERYCGEHDILVDDHVLVALYEDPDKLDVVPAGRLRLLARSLISQAVDERMMAVLKECTQAARETAKLSLSDIAMPLAGNAGIIGLLRHLISFKFPFMR